jgi:hypothetical protein
VLFLNVPLHGHINPTLDLASELVTRGNDVVYYASASFREKIEATGAEFRFQPQTLPCPALPIVVCCAPRAGVLSDQAVCVMMVLRSS